MRELVINNFDFSDQAQRAILTEHKNFVFGRWVCPPLDDNLSYIFESFFTHGAIPPKNRNF